MLNECIGLNQNFENVEIIKCETNSTEYYAWSLDSKTEVKTSKLSIIKLKINTNLAFCKLCNQLHISNDASRNSTNENLASIFNINNLLFATLLNAGFKQNDVYCTIKQRKMQLRKKLESAHGVLNYFKSCIHNGDKIIKQYCDQVRKQIQFHHEHKIDQLVDLRNQIFKDLNECEQRCLRSVDLQGAEWTNFRMFHLNAFNFINLFDINSLFDQEVDDDISLLLDSQELALSEASQKLDSHLLMNKKFQFVPIFSDKLMNETFNQIGFLNLTEICSNNNPVEIEQYIRLSDALLSKQAVEEWNSMTLEESYIEKCDNNVITIHSVDMNIIICNRYTKSDKVIQSDLMLVDCFNNMIKKLSFTNSMVRCVATNSSYVLITVKSDEENNSANQFSISLYDCNLDLIRSISINSTDPQALYMDEEKCYLFTSSSPMISVFNLSLNLIAQFGQNHTSKEAYYFKIKPDYFVIKNLKCYLCERQENKTTSVIVTDLTTGACLKEIILDFNFNKFAIYSNDLLVFLTEYNKLVCYDLTNESLKHKIDLLNENTITFSSFDINKFGFVVCLSSSTYKIAVY